jgi:pSer/pThr/pTyr-binding forkhead associated (FHA) protein
VEEYLEQQCQLIMKDVQEHAKEKIADLKAEYATGRKQIEKMLVQSTDTNTKLCVTLKVNTGPHLGQKFRLELTEGKTEDTFRLGRSGAKLYKEKGVSLYKDKEVSTTHARIEIRNGEAFYIDTRSTNGSSLNGMRVEVNVPYNIKEGDMLSIGASECSVSIAASDGPEEDFASV